MTVRDVLTAVLSNSNYPDSKRESFIRTFYDYLFVKLLAEIEKDDPTLYQKLMAYFDDPVGKSQEIQEGMQEAYQNPVLKEKMDKVVEEIAGELTGDIASYATQEQKQKIISSLPAA